MTLQYQEIALEPQVENLVGELRGMIDQARGSIASTINSTLTLLYWHVGNKIHKEILREKLLKAIEHSRKRLDDSSEE